MGKGKVFCFFGAILTLLATFLLSFGYDPVTDNNFFGIGFLMNIDDIFENTSSYALLFGGNDIVVYILFIVLIIFLISGFIQLAGIKKRAAAIIGSLFPIFISLVFISYFYDILIPEPITNITSFFMNQAIIEGVLPLHVIAGTTATTWEVSLGTYILLAGGVLGFIGGLMGVE